MMDLSGSYFRVFCFILTTIFLFVGCGQSEEDQSDSHSPVPSPQTLYYFTWSDYADPALLTEFEKRTGTRVIVDTFSSNEELLAKVQNGASGYDVVVPSDFMAGVMGKLGLLAELDLQRIPNVQLLEVHLQGLPFDPQQRFAIPYLWGTVGIGYDSEVFPNPPDSWEILWDPDYRGRISMLNDQREVFGLALRAMGHSLNSRDPLVIEQVKEKLIRQKPLVKTYTSEHFDQLLVSGEVVLAHAWGGPIARATRERPSVKYVVPREGGTIWTDCLAVPKTSKKKQLAMEFINYLLEVDVAVRTSTQLLFASANRMVKDRLDQEIRENPAVYPPLATVSRMEWMTDVGDAIRFYDRAWTELKVH